MSSTYNCKAQERSWWQGLEPVVHFSQINNVLWHRGPSHLPFGCLGFSRSRSRVITTSIYKFILIHISFTLLFQTPSTPMAAHLFTYIGCDGSPKGDIWNSSSGDMCLAWLWCFSYGYQTFRGYHKKEEPDSRVGFFCTIDCWYELPIGLWPLTVVG